MVKAHLALLNAGKLDAVYTAINALASPEKDAALIWFDKAPTVERTHPLVGQIGEAIGLTDSDIDNLMIAADAIPG